MTTPDDKAIEAACDAYVNYKSRGLATSPRGRMRAAIAAYEAALWQPIDETTPRNDFIFGVIEDGSIEVVSWYSDSSNKQPWFRTKTGYFHRLLCWRLIPSSPKGRP